MSVADPEKFWGDQAKSLEWIKPFTKVKDTSFEAPNVHIRWFEDGRCFNMKILTFLCVCGKVGQVRFADSESKILSVGAGSRNTSNTSLAITSTAAVAFGGYIGSGPGRTADVQNYNISTSQNSSSKL